MTSSILKTTKFKYPDRYFSPRKERPMADDLKKHLQSLGATAPPVPAEVGAVDLCQAYNFVKPFLAWLTWIPTVGTYITYFTAIFDKFCPTAAARDAAFKKAA